GEPDTVEHEPASLLGHAERPRQLVARNAVLGVGEQPNSGQPLVPTKRRVLENGPDLGRELLFALAAGPEVPGADKERLFAPAARTRHVAVRPSKLDDGLKGGVRVSEIADGFAESLRGVALGDHGGNMSLPGHCVKYISTKESTAPSAGSTNVILARRRAAGDRRRSQPSSASASWSSPANFASISRYGARPKRPYATPC